jgi:hypothetical protein
MTSKARANGGSERTATEVRHTIAAVDIAHEIVPPEFSHAATDFVLDEFAKLPWMAFEHEANKKHCEAAAALVTAPKTDCG